MNRLTTDTPHGNFETMMNFAYAKDGEVWIRGAGGDGGDRKLNEYIFNVLLGDKYYCEVDHPDDVPEFCLDGCFCELGALFAAATQAAELRARLAAYEDTGLEPEEMRELLHDSTGPLHKKLGEWIDAEQEGRLLVLPCKVGDTVYLPATDDWGDILSYEVVEMGIDRDGPYFVINDEDHDHTPIEELGKSVFMTREKAEAALKVGGENG